MTEREDLTIAMGKYIVANSATVRAAAQAFELGKSTVHKDMTQKLPVLDSALAERVRLVLDYNLSVRHLRGGEATRLRTREKGS